MRTKKQDGHTISGQTLGRNGKSSFHCHSSLILGALPQGNVLSLPFFSGDALLGLGNSAG